MRSLKAIPFLYQAKVKFPPLTFDLNISVAQPTVILFVYCLWPVSDTIISDAMTWSWYSRCFALSTFWSFFDFSEIWWPSTWCCFIIKHQWLGKLNGELTKLRDIPFFNAKLLKVSPMKDSVIHFADISEIQKTLIYQCFVFAGILYRAIIIATSLPHPYLAIGDYNQKTWTGFFYGVTVSHRLTALIGSTPAKLNANATTFLSIHVTTTTPDLRSTQ